MPSRAQPAARPRKLPQPRYRTLRISKRIKHTKPALPSASRLFGRSLLHLWRYKRLFGSLFLAYLVLSLIFVRSGADPATVSEAEVSRTYQMILLVMISLAVIWGLRQTAGKTRAVSFRDSFYKSMHPLVPFQLVSVVILLELIPMAIAAYLYQQIFNSTLVATAPEQVLWAVFIGMLCLLSLYLLASSIFALYIVTLPDTWPSKALKTASDLVRFRRWIVVRKLIFLIVAGGLSAGILFVPVVLFAPGVADGMGFLLGLAAVFVFHSFVYHLYKELLA